MGYACPVCETPQADGRHLANHLAFTAMIHGDDHEAWLAEHAPGWAEAGERELAKRVVEIATETEFPPGSGDVDGHRGTGSHGHRDQDHGHGHGGDRNDRAERRPGPDSGSMEVAVDTDIGSDGEDDRDVAAVVAEARELTRRMRGGIGPDENGEAKASKRGDRSGRGRDGDGTREEIEDENRSDGRNE